MNTFLLYTLGVVSFSLAIIISIGLHELGHMIPAKKFGAKVTQYFVGFGPTLWSKKRGETEYGVKAVPLGGFVRIIGMLPPGKNQRYAGEETDDDKVKIKAADTGIFTQLVTSARNTEYETIDRADADRLFYKLSWWKKLIVMAAGPSVNIALAFFCFLGVFSLYGERHVDPSPEGAIVAQVTHCAVGDYGVEAKECDEKDWSPARKAGLEKDDKIIALGSTPIATWDQLVKLVQANGGETSTITVMRKGEELQLPLTIGSFIRPDQDNRHSNSQAGFLGVAPKVVMVKDTKGVGYTLEYMKDSTVQVAQALSTIPAKLVNLSNAVLGLEDRDPNGPVSIIGGARFSGEAAAYEAPAGETPVYFTDKVAAFFMLVGAFNFFIGLFNFLPLLPLDGGHMIGALWEGLKRGFAKTFKLKVPGPVDTGKMLPVAYGFGIILFLVGMLVMTADLIVPIKLYG